MIKLLVDCRHVVVFDNDLVVVLSVGVDHGSFKFCGTLIIDLLIKDRIRNLMMFYHFFRLFVSSLR